MECPQFYSKRGVARQYIAHAQVLRSALANDGVRLYSTFTPLFLRFFLVLADTLPGVLAGLAFT